MIQKTIMNLKELIGTLKPMEKRIAGEMFDISEGVCEFVVQNEFEPLARKYFGNPDESLEEIKRRIERQKIVRIKNRYTNEEALFNALRASRPGMSTNKDSLSSLYSDINSNAGTDDFCHANTNTPMDTIPRVTGKHCIISPNAAALDEISGIVVFNRHNPLDITQEEFSDYVNTAFEWYARKVEHLKKNNPKLNLQKLFPFFMWNCLWKSGGSIVHGHAQVLIAREHPYSYFDSLKQGADKFTELNGDKYFQSWIDVHRELGLSYKKGEADVVVSITPRKEKEITVISPFCDISDNKGREDLISESYKSIRSLIDKTGMLSFNYALMMPPIEKSADYFDVPNIAKIVDRGDPLKRVSDFAALEIYGTPVVASDPYKVYDAITK